MSENTLGPQNGNWREGSSFEPYPPEFNGRLKEMIRDRDGRLCQVCGVVENGTAHCVHHIDYDKDNNDPLNLITLCNSHHSETNGTREEWIAFFSAL